MIKQLNLLKDYRIKVAFEKIKYMLFIKKFQFFDSLSYTCIGKKNLNIKSTYEIWWFKPPKPALFTFWRKGTYCVSLWWYFTIRLFISSLVGTSGSGQFWVCITARRQSCVAFYFGTFVGRSDKSWPLFLRVVCPHFRLKDDFEW